MPSILKACNTRRRKAWIAVFAAIALALGIGTAAGAPQAIAAAFGFATGGDLQQQFLTQDAATLVPTTPGWHDVPTTAMRVFVPGGTTRLVHATYNAESVCLGASWCSLQVVAVNATTGGVTGLLPNSGTDYAFDSPPDQWEGHAVSRVVRLPGGSGGTWYLVKVQATVVGATSSSVFRLDDYMTQVEVAA